jgi:hypothetical protein
MAVTYLSLLHNNDRPLFPMGIRSIGQGKARQRLKLGGGQAYDRSSD